MDSLPFEILCEIMSQLDARHRLIASLVCRRWFEACSTQLKDVRLNLDPKKCPGIPFPPWPPLRPYCDVSLENTDVDRRCVDLLNHLGPHLKHLRVKYCSVSCCPGSIECHQLLTLQTTEANVVTALAPPLPRLEALDLCDSKDVSDATLKLIDAENLKEFVIPNYTGWELDDDKSRFPLSCGAVEEFILKHAKTLTTLRLPIFTPGHAALRITSTPGLKLTNVTLQCVYNVHRLEEQLQAIEELKHLEVLKLSAYFFEYEKTETVARLLPDLREFSINGKFFQKEALVPLFRLYNLRCLYVKWEGFLHETPNMSDSDHALAKLLELEDNETIVDTMLRELPKRAAALRELTMGSHYPLEKFVRVGENFWVSKK